MNKRNIFRLVLPVLVILLFAGVSYGQDEDDGLKKVVIFEKETKLELPSAVRQYEKISYEQPVGENKPLDYDFSEVDLRLPKMDMKVKVPTIKPPELKKLYGNYVKAGFGNYATPYLEGYFNNKRSEDYTYGLHFRHLSSQRGPVRWAGTSNNDVSAYGKYFMGSSVASARIGYQRNMVHYYGFNPVMEFDRDTLRQVYNIFSAQADISNSDKDAAMHYNAGVEFYNLSSRMFAAENEIIGRLNTTYHIDNTYSLNLKGMYSTSSRSEGITQTRNYVLVQPGFLINREQYSLRTGVNVAYSNDTLNDPSEVHFYPDIELNYHFIKNKLTFFGGLTGELEKNVLRTFVDQNPFLGSGVPLSHTNKTMELYGGAKGHILEKLNYKAQVSYSTYRNLWFFVNSPEDSSRFTLMYDPGNSTVLNLSGNASYEVSRRLRLGLTTEFFNYSVNTEQAWHRPSFINTFNASYNLHDKIFFNTDIYYISGISARNFTTGQTFDLPSIVDMNVKIDYRFSPLFSAFVEANNILSKNYQRYLYYPVRGVNILGGLTYSF
ncbi:MAG: hypothetical protein ACK4ND_03330 [Cytophagaceae bacterium]